MFIRQKVPASSLIFATLFFTSGTTWAEDFAEMSLKELLEVDVFTAASLLPTQTSKAPGTVYSFNREYFSRFGVRRLDDLLQFVPGIQLNQYRKRHRSVWARGLIDRYNDKLVLLIDGVRMQHLYYGHFSLGDNLPLERIEKVEVIIGPASSLYGANAFGGIISITTRDFADEPSVELSLEAANNARGKGSFLYNNSKFQAFGNHLRQDAPFRKERKSFTGEEVLQPLDEDYTNLHLKAKVVPGLMLKFDYAESETPFLFIPSTQDAYVEEKAWGLAAAYEHGNLETGRIEGNVYFQSDKAREYEKEQTTQSLGYEEFQNATMAGMGITGLKRLDDHVLAAGISWQLEKAEKTRYERLFHFRDGFLDPTEKGDLLSRPGISNHNYAAFIQDVWNINPKLDLTLGARYDNFEQFDDYFNYRGALVYNPDDSQTWKLMYGTAIRTPTSREYLKVLQDTDFVPEAPDAESINSLELGYIYQWDEANLSINLFRNTLTDFIREVPTPDEADEYFANSNGSLRLEGVESLFHIRPLDTLLLRAGISYLKSDDSKSGELPYLASWSSSFLVDYNYHASHSVGFSLVHNDSRSDTNGFDDEAGSFVMANLFASGQFSPRLSYSLGIDNLFDEKVVDLAGDFGWQHNTERSEREFWIHLDWTLGD